MNADAIEALNKARCRLMSATKMLQKAIADVGNLNADIVFAADGTGPVIESPDETKYRIIVANDGTLSTEVVP